MLIVPYLETQSAPGHWEKGLELGDGIDFIIRGGVESLPQAEQVDMVALKGRWACKGELITFRTVAVWRNCFYVKAGFFCHFSNANFVYAALIKLFSGNLMNFF